MQRRPDPADQRRRAAGSPRSPTPAAAGSAWSSTPTAAWWCATSSAGCCGSGRTRHDAGRRRPGAGAGRRHRRRADALLQQQRGGRGRHHLLHRLLHPLRRRGLQGRPARTCRHRQAVPARPGRHGTPAAGRPALSERRGAGRGRVVPAVRPDRRVLDRAALADRSAAGASDRSSWRTCPPFPTTLPSAATGCSGSRCPRPATGCSTCSHPRHPLLRKLTWALPEALQPKEGRTVFAQAFDADGRLVHDLQQPNRDFYMCSGVRERDGVVWFGSLVCSAVGRRSAGPAGRTALRRCQLTGERTLPGIAGGELLVPPAPGGLPGASDLAPTAGRCPAARGRRRRGLRRGAAGRAGRAGRCALDYDQAAISHLARRYPALHAGAGQPGRAAVRGTAAFDTWSVRCR